MALTSWLENLSIRRSGITDIGGRVPGCLRTILRVGFLLPALCHPGWAQELDEVPSYTYAVFAGTGFYKVDDRDVFVLRIPARYEFRPPTTDKFGAKLLLPVTLGISNFDNLEEFETEDLATIAFVPGIELDFLVTPDWSIKPFGQIGYGWELNSGDTDVIWGAGVKTRYEITSGDWRTWLGAEYLLAGKSPTDSDPSTNADRISAGIDVSHPIKWSIAERRTSLHGRVIYRNFTDELIIRTSDPDAPIEISQTTEVALALGVEPAIKFLGIPVNQLGLGYRFGDYEAIILATTFPF